MKDRVPAGLGSEFPVGAAGWWLQHSAPPAHENVVPRTYSSGSFLHSDNIQYVDINKNKKKHATIEREIHETQIV